MTPSKNASGGPWYLGLNCDNYISRIHNVSTSLRCFEFNWFKSSITNIPINCIPNPFHCIPAIEAHLQEMLQRKVLHYKEWRKYNLQLSCFEIWREFVQVSRSAPPYSLHHALNMCRHLPPPYSLLLLCSHHRVTLYLFLGYPQFFSIYLVARSAVLPYASEAIFGLFRVFRVSFTTVHAVKSSTCRKCRYYSFLRGRIAVSFGGVSQSGYFATTCTSSFSLTAVLSQDNAMASFLFPWSDTSSNFPCRASMKSQASSSSLSTCLMCPFSIDGQVGHIHACQTHVTSSLKSLL